MANYLISYDLNEPGKNYDDLYEAIKNASNGTWCKPLRSVYVIQSSLSAKQIYDKLSPCLDANDLILVIEVTKHAYWYLNKKVSDYLQKMLQE